jgi:malate synthase
MTSPVTFGQLGVSPVLFEFIRNEALPGTGISELNFWRGLEALLNDLAPRNAELLRHRDHLQAQIDEWHRTHPGGSFDRVQYTGFLEEIGYLEPPIADFQIATRNIDPEIASAAAPQLVVPFDNARYALNAANERWGSLFDALYGTDALDELNGAERTTNYNPVRGARGFRYVQDFLDRCFPLRGGSHRDATAYVIA